ncbi:bromodomain-containing protein [Tritrichomonas foetus]|uniref:Bromodomain-containing protein n=1 Tax=Tritrichomonas foetus TaxID=1144522 RepID=A0A1J4K725_9EUKA|nr:bromodomain-containing protein [Tritrichomonas foetus]|eukprot:OHT07175.1 bromodomain-containing protein [Tritrichomonas foetus]
MGITKYQRSQCKSIVEKLTKLAISLPFQQKLTEKDGLPCQIHDIIERPMDLSIIKRNLDDGRYKSIQQWEQDMRLIWDNATLLYRPGTPIYAMAKDCIDWFDKQMESFSRSKSERWLVRFNKTHQKLQKLVDSYPGEKRSRSTEREIEESNAHIIKEENTISHSQERKVEVKNHEKSFNDVNLFDNIDDTPTTHNPSHYKAIIAEDPRGKEKKEELIELFPGL